MDVEGILNQIRERVVSEHTAPASDTSLAPNGSPSNGSSPVSRYDDALQRLRALLAISGRAADRVPPIFSNRQGARARFELWIKSKSKRLTRWFTWEQVNFNRAVNEALTDVVELLRGEAQELSSLREQLLALRSQTAQEVNRQLTSIRTETGEMLSETAARLQRLDATVAEVKHFVSTEQVNKHSQLETEHSMLAARYQALLDEHNGLAAEHIKLADQVIELAAQLRAEDRELKSEQQQEIDRRLSQLAADLKEEQRVCFRQISLESGESAILEDRARRELLARMDKLEAALKTGNR